MNKIRTKLLALALSLALLFATIPTAVFSAQTVDRAKLPIAVISDTHYFPDSLSDNFCEAYRDFCKNADRQFGQCAELLDAALKTVELHAKKNGIKYVLMPGDITKDGEYEGHVELASKLEAFEERSGIQILVTNGNHDINNSNTVSFVDGVRTSARKTAPEDFLNIYQNLGYDLACSRYYPESGKHGMLSYAARLEGGYRILVVDSCKYSSDITESGADEHETGGCLTDGLKAWITEQSNEAKAVGETLMLMTHPSTVPHFDTQETFFKEFVLDDWEQCADFLADAGVRYCFTGHMHITDVADYVSDNGNPICDISTSSLTGFPNMFHEIIFDNTGDSFDAEINTFDVDCEYQIVADGVTYEKPYKQTFSLHKTFGADLKSFAMNMVWGIVLDYCNKITEAGSIVEFLKNNMDIDLETIITNYIGNGVTLGKAEIFTIKNIMSFVEDFDKQVVDNYISKPDKLYEIVTTVIDTLLNFEVSDYSATTFYDSYGIGTPGKKATLQEVAYTALVYVYNDNMDASNDEFMMDVVNGFKTGDTFERLYNVLLDTVLNYLLQDEILSTLELHIDALFPDGSFGHVLGKMLNGFIMAVFAGDRSFENIANTILGLGFFENYNDLNSLAYYYIDEYLTKSQLESLGYYAGSIIEDIVTDDTLEDNDITMSYSGYIKPEATAENYRLPSDIALTVGEDAADSVAINWYTKYSVTASDIEIVPYDVEYSFTGIPSIGNGIAATSSATVLGYPAVDFGIFGFMDSSANMVRHSIVLTELEPGTKYMYRVGDATKGWWSETGVFETADESDSVTFLHITDPQSQNAVQYGAFADVLRTARDVYDDIDFIMSTGDQVDNGENMNQWQWLLNTASDTLMDIPFMPTTGNHEDEGAALDPYFVLPNVPQQDTETGVYYSFDYNNLHIAVLNTNDLDEEEGLTDTQLSWLTQDMNGSDAQWKAVALHKAPYSNGSHYDDGDVVAIREQLSGLMTELDVDLVLQGHDHVYLRTDVMSENKIVETGETTVTLNGVEYRAKIQPDGTVYVISGCSGVKYYLLKDATATDELFPRAEAIVEVPASMFSGIQIKGDTLYFDAYKVLDDGSAEKIDSFAITHEELEPDNEGLTIFEIILRYIRNLFEETFARIKAALGVK